MTRFRKKCTENLQRTLRDIAKCGMQKLLTAVCSQSTVMLCNEYKDYHPVRPTQALHKTDTPYEAAEISYP